MSITEQWLLGALELLMEFKNMQNLPLPSITWMTLRCLFNARKTESFGCVFTQTIAYPELLGARVEALWKPCRRAWMKCKGDEMWKSVSSELQCPLLHCRAFALACAQVGQIVQC